MSELPGPSPAAQRRWARWAFAVLAAGGAGWWAAVFTVAPVRAATLGALSPGPVAALDLPLFVGAAGLAAAGIRWSAAVCAAWTVLVAGGMALYATLTTLAGWGAVAMIAATAVAVPSALVLWRGRLPTEWALRGPFGFHTTRLRTPGAVLAATFAQLAFFWGLFLGVLPAVILWLESRWGLHLGLPAALRWAGAAAFLGAGALGVASAVTMSLVGRGTPLPSTMARRLVVRGPYRWVRNPMAVAGVAQGVSVGLMIGSWMTVVYALCGALVWNAAVRPHEEADLSQRFGEEFDRYRERVACWWPRRPVLASSP